MIVAALKALRRRWRRDAAALYRLTTAHGTRVVLRPFHDIPCHTNATDDCAEAYLLVLSEGDAFFIRRIETQAGPKWLPANVAIRVALDANSCTLRHPVTATFYSAEPLAADQAMHHLTLRNRREAGAFERFELVACEMSRSLRRSASYRALLTLVATRPSLGELLQRVQSGRGPRSLHAVKAYLACRFEREDVRSLSLSDVIPALTMIADPHDPWMGVGLPSLSRWEANRGAVPSHLTIGEDLDAIVAGFDGPRLIGRTWVAEKRALVTPRRGACILASARNEGAYLVEWIAYHRAIGFEHIFLYSNDNDDHSDVLLDALARQGLITWIDNSVGPIGRPQLKAYGHALGIMPELLDFEWCLAIDIDEYLAFDKSKFDDVRDYLSWQDRNPVHSISFNWVHFGTYGIRRFAPEHLVTRRFTLRRPHYEKYGKSIFKPQHFDMSHCHYPFVIEGHSVIYRNSSAEIYRYEEEFAAATDLIAEDAWINHYFSKSVDDMLWKCSRNLGDRTKVESYSPLLAARDAYTRVLEPETHHQPVRDGRILDCVPNLENDVEAILDKPGVRAAYGLVQETVRDRIRAIRREIAERGPILAQDDLGPIIALMADE